MSDIEGIPQEKLDRLWMHLEETERLSGKKLRKTPYTYLDSCPVYNFAPQKFCDNYDGRAIYKLSDSTWWGDLPRKQRIQITKWVMKKIKERNKVEE